MSQNVVVFFNKDVIIIKALMIALLFMKIAFFGGGGGNSFCKTVEVALQKLLGGGGLHDCLRLPRLLTTNTGQLEILATTLL